jgi:hypothetical protein
LACGNDPVEVGIASERREALANFGRKAVEQHDAPIGVQTKRTPLPDRHVVVSVGEKTLLRGRE